MSSENLEIMEDATSKKEAKNSTTVIDNTPWYCYLEEAGRVFLNCLGFENHESTKSGIEEKEVVVVEDSSSSSRIISSEKDGENCEVSKPSAVQDSSGSNAGGGGSGATDPAASTTDDPDAADSPSTADPTLASPAIIADSPSTADPALASPAIIADSPSTADPALASPAIISVEDTATTAARRSSRPPINSGSGPQTN